MDENLLHVAGRPAFPEVGLISFEGRTIGDSDPVPPKIASMPVQDIVQTNELKAKALREAEWLVFGHLGRNPPNEAA